MFSTWITSVTGLNRACHTFQICHPCYACHECHTFKNFKYDKITSENLKSMLASCVKREFRYRNINKFGNMC